MSGVPGAGTRQTLQHTQTVGLHGNPRRQTSNVPPLRLPQ